MECVPHALKDHTGEVYVHHIADAPADQAHSYQQGDSPQGEHRTLVPVADEQQQEEEDQRGGDAVVDLLDEPAVRPHRFSPRKLVKWRMISLLWDLEMKIFLPSTTRYSLQALDTNRRLTTKERLHMMKCR